MEDTETGYVFRAMTPEKDRNPLVNNGSIEELVEDPGEFTFQQMIEQLERDGGYRNLRDEVYANWTTRIEWLERFTGEQSIVIIADRQSIESETRQYGQDLYIEKLPWNQVEELVYPETEKETVENQLQDTEVKLTPVENFYHQVNRQYGTSRNIAVLED